MLLRALQSCALLVLIACRACPGAGAQAVLPLHAFSLSSTEPLFQLDSIYDPVQPLALGPDGSFYGVSNGGGLYLQGEIFRITPSGVLTSVHSFDWLDGQTPSGPLLSAQDGWMYGVCSHGGAVDGGVLYRVKPDGTFEIVYNFGAADGTASPMGQLAQRPNGAIYGIAIGGYTGPVDHSASVVWRRDPSGAVTAIHRFPGDSTDGYSPSSGVTLASDDNLYGITRGGGAHGNGTVYQIDAYDTEHVIANFDWTISFFSQSPALVEGADGRLYFTDGGSRLYAVTATGQIALVSSVSTMSTLSGCLAVWNGRVVAVSIGSYEPGDRYADIYAVDPFGATQDLHVFSQSEGGSTSSGSIVGADGNLYGFNTMYGEFGNGVFWRYSADGTLTVLHPFQQGGYAGFAFGPSPIPDGLLLAASRGGGGYGGVLRADPTGDVTTLLEFNGWNTGNPALGGDGNIYGLASTIPYRATLSGEFDPLLYAGMFNFTFGPVFPTGGGNHTLFVEGTLRETPYTDAIIGLDQAGNIVFDYPIPLEVGQNLTGGFSLFQNYTMYGVLQLGGQYGYGTLFKTDPTGYVQILHYFDGLTGAQPTDPPASAPDGALYGMTTKGGAYGLGVVYRLGAGHPYQVLHDFSPSDDALPSGRLMVASDGRVYGLGTNRGGVGPAGAGILFRIDPASGSYQILHRFQSATEGSEPIGPLVQIGGDLYGVTSSGGPLPLGAGTLFRVNLNLSDHDFTGAGTPGLVFQNNTTGSLVAWTLANGAQTGAVTVSNSLAPVWAFCCAYDLNLDGKPDLIFQNRATGEVDVWTSQAGAGYQASVFASVAPSWHPICVADLDGSTHPYLLWQNDSTGGIAWWHLNGTSVLGAGTLVESLGAQQALVCAADMNGDGYPDLLFQQRSTGDLSLWTMKGTSILAEMPLATGIGAGWRLAGAVDLNGDYNPDLIWQSASGAVDVWYMQGMAVTSKAQVGLTSPDWTLIER